MRTQSISRASAEALQVLGASIRAARLRRRWTLDNLAERVGVSRPTMAKVERGDAGVAVGTMFEAATLLGVPLFDEDEDNRARYGAHKRAELSLLPTSARPRRPIDDDF
jgi:transcriptional regulator with XRE-family HTH domain